MKRDPRKVAMVISLATAVVMLVGKLSAYALTHSAAIFSDAAESVVHGVATALAVFSLWYAGRPADTKHPYGYGRIVYFSAGFEGMLVAATSLVVVWSGMRGLLYGVQVSHLGLGLAISGILAAINLVLGWALVRIGRRHNALVLVANGKHVLSDVLTTAAAIVGIGLVMITGYQQFDPLAALVIGILILISGLGLLRQAFGGLMDEVDPAIMDQLTQALDDQKKKGQIEGFHQLRCNKMNDELWVVVHLLLPGHISMRDAHGRVTQTEEALRNLPLRDRIHITSHLEPADHHDAHPNGHLESDPQET